MSFAKVRKCKKPISWWVHKILCEIGWNFIGHSSNMYYSNLFKLCSKGFNIYGEEIQCPI